MTTPRPHAELAARNAAVIWLYQRAADQACINASYPKLVARYPEWVKSQQTMESLAQELGISPQAWAEFDKCCRRWGMKQRGYYDLNVTGFIIGCLIVGVAIGIAIAYLVPWLWSFIKPLIHALTA